jgi:hypothetical protein
MDNPLNSLSPTQLAESLTQLPKPTLEAALTTIVKKLNLLQLTRVLSTLSQPKLLSILLKLLSCLDVDRLTQLINAAHTERDRLTLEAQHPTSPQFLVATKMSRGRRYACVRNGDRSIELNLGRLDFEMGKIYRLCHLDSLDVHYLRCLRLYIPQGINPQIDRKGLLEVEWLNEQQEVLRQETYEFPQCMKAELSRQHWQIEAIPTPDAPTKAGRLDHIPITPQSPKVTACLTLPPDRSAKVTQALQQWVELSTVSAGDRWTLIESYTDGQKTLLDGKSQPILTYAYKDHQILLLVPAERLMVMLRHLCQEATRSPSRTHQELARPIWISLKTAPYQSFEQVIEYTLLK